MNIAFSSNQICLRGTSVALYDYAYFNETILNNKSIIIARHPDIWKYSHPKAIKRFEDRFPVYFYKDFSEVEKILDDNNIDLFYAIKAGINDGVISTKRKSVNHIVFDNYQPHGDISASVSEWLGNKLNLPFVPHMINLPDITNDLRSELNIPKDAIVMGRYGGTETFDIQFVYSSIIKILNKRNDIHFLFMNTNKFYEHPNIIYLEAESDLEYKVRFINTCDAHLHGRRRGESYGLTIAEFSSKNKPVLTFGGEQTDKAHIDMLKGNCYLYHNEQELFDIINNFKVIDKDWNMYKDYTPEKVMEKFKKVFID